MTTRAHIINLALVDIGQTPMLSEDGPPGDGYVLQYDNHIGALVSSYPWTFQTGLVKLARLTAPPEVHWQFMYDLPSDMAGAPRAAYPRSDLREPTTDWELRDGRLYANQPEIWLRYPLRPDPTRWPPYFTGLAVLVMKAQFALSVREDTVLWRNLTEIAFGDPRLNGEGGKFAEAKTIDASGKPSERIPIGNNPLVSVRFT
jgi:hypothetical protein